MRTFLLSCVTVKSRRRTSVTARTVVLAVDELLAGIGSGSVAETVAVFGIATPVAVAWTMTSTNCELATPNVPRYQLIVVVPLQEPMLGFADMNVMLTGSVSLTVTLCATAGPLLVTVNRYVTGWPTPTGSGESVFTMAMSAFVRAATRLVAVESLLDEMLSVPVVPICAV